MEKESRIKVVDKTRKIRIKGERKKNMTENAG